MGWDLRAKKEGSHGKFSGRDIPGGGNGRSKDSKVGMHLVWTTVKVTIWVEPREEGGVVQDEIRQRPELVESCINHGKGYRLYSKHSKQSFESFR